MRNNILESDLKNVINLLQEKDPRLTSGPKVFEFEQQWSKWLGVKYSVFVNSGSSSNLLAMAWLKSKFPNGGKVIVPPFTWSSDISSLLWMGFEPVFIDISLNTLGIDESRLLNKLDEINDICAIFITHAQGFNALTTNIIDLCKSKKIYLIEDVCESHGALIESDKKAGSVGDISCFSFYYAHHMSTIEGGMICTNDEDIYQYLRMLRGHGMLREASNEELKKYYYDEFPDLNRLFIFPIKAFNVRNNEIGALIGLSQLERLDNMILKRNENHHYFLNGLPDWAFKDFNIKGESNYAFNLVLNDKSNDLMNGLEKHLSKAGVEYRRGSAGGGNQLRQPYLREYVNTNKINIPYEFPNADHMHFYSMYLGNYPELEQNQIDSLLDILHQL